jgi:GTP 3',8-cyclase
MGLTGTTGRSILGSIMNASAAPFFEYLRVSITDRCNLRCIYCMPAEGVEKLSHGNILRYEEILTVIRAAVAEGVFRVRITGGEPLVRRGVTGFLADVAATPGVRDLSLTTNGILLADMAVGLRQAGLRRINVSLDSLRPDRYAAITRGGDLERVLAGIQAATLAGLAPVKVNVVLMPGHNEDEVEEFARFAHREQVHVRFIEHMPFMETPESAGFVSQDDVLARIQAVLPVVPSAARSGGGPAEEYQFVAGSTGRIGFISPRTHPYCARCTRLRLTASGLVLPCLDSPTGRSVRDLEEGPIREIIRELASAKRSAAKPCAGFDGARCISLSDIGG